MSPSFIPNVLVDTASGQIAISLGIKGPNYAVVSACATGSHAIGEAAELIKRGDADAMIAGGTEACDPPDHPRRLHRDARARRPRTRIPPRASRPFDATRAGFVMSRGRRRGRARGLGARRAPRRDDLRRGARLRRLERRAQPRPARARGDRRRDDDAPRARARRRRAASASATSTRTAPPPRSATPPRRRRSRTSSATTPTSSPSPRRSR